MNSRIHSNKINLKYPTYFYINGKISCVRFICRGCHRLVYIKDKLYTIVKDDEELYGFAVVLPIRETEEELKAKGIKYHFYDSVNDLIDK